MPTLQLSEQEIHILVNDRAMRDPIIAKIMGQLEAQRGGNGLDQGGEGYGAAPQTEQRPAAATD